jgi:RHS repeat-associated protein
VVQRQYYTPYGTSAYQYTAHGSLTSVDFTGQRLDDSDGLLYFGARYYDAALSYFISADVLIADSTHAQNLNRYSYASNNPLRFTDPTGRCVFQQDSSGQEQFTDPEKLDCTVSQFDHMSSNQRILWTQAFQLYYSLSHVFNGVVGAIMYFDASWQTGGINFTPGSSWMSLADAWTLAAMEDGMALYQNTIGNNGVRPVNFVGGFNVPLQWMKFYQRLAAAHGDFYAPGVANAWGVGEYAGVHYGIDQADQARGRPLGEEGYILDRAIEATDVFRLKLMVEGVPPQYRGGTFDPTSDPGWQVGAGLAVDFEARTEWNSGLLGGAQWMYYTRIPLLRYGMH